MVLFLGTAILSWVVAAAMAAATVLPRDDVPAPPLTCLPIQTHPGVPTFHIIGSVSRNASLPGGLEFEHINDANGIFQ